MIGRETVAAYGLLVVDAVSIPPAAWVPPFDAFIDTLTQKIAVRFVAAAGPEDQRGSVRRADFDRELT